MRECEHCRRSTIIRSLWHRSVSFSLFSVWVTRWRSPRSQCRIRRSEQRAAEQIQQRGFSAAAFTQYEHKTFIGQLRAETVKRRTAQSVFTDINFYDILDQHCRSPYFAIFCPTQIYRYNCIKFYSCCQFRIREFNIFLIILGAY